MTDLGGKVCLITGASGFVGGWVADKVVRAGGRARCLVRRSSNRAHLTHPEFEFCLGDVVDPDSLSRAVSGVDIVFHVAGLIKSPRVEDYFRVNYLGTINLLESIRQRRSPPDRVVVVSSQAAIGPSAPGKPVNEDSRPRPFSPYGKSKLLEERAAFAYRERLPIVIARPPSVYGPRDRETLILFKIIARGIRPVFGFPGAISVIHVSDLADGLILAASHPAAVGRSFFLAGDETPTPSELASTIAAGMGQTGVPIPISAGALRIAGRVAEIVRGLTGWPLIFDRWKAEEIASGFWACSNQLARELIGFSPKYPLNEGLAETANWYRVHHWI